MLLKQDRSEKIKSEFKALRSRQLTVTSPIIPVMIFLLFYGDKKPIITIMGIPIVWLAIPFAVFLLIFSLWHWRCPACRGYLGKRTNPKYCPKCGVELR
jgi:hypothetical protein